MAGDVRRWMYERTNIRRAIRAECKSKIPDGWLEDLQASIWCELPESLWDAFRGDALLLAQIHEAANDRTNKTIAEWAKLCDAAANTLDPGDPEAATAKLVIAGKKLREAWEKDSVAAVEAIFQAKAGISGDVTHRKFKAGARMATASPAAVTTPMVSTAITPAPLTLIAAADGLISQITDAAKEAKSIHHRLAKEILSSRESWVNAVEMTRADKMGTEFEAARPALLRGVSSLQDESDVLNSKLDGLEADLHRVSGGLNLLLDAQEEIRASIATTEAALAEATSRDVPVFQDRLRDYGGQIEALEKNFERSFNAVADMSQNIDAMRSDNQQIAKTLKDIADALQAEAIGLPRQGRERGLPKER